MDKNYWHRQTPEEPLFPDLLWSRPENKQNAGKLLIVGGNAFGFAAAAEAYGEASRAGIGTARVLLPDSLRKTVGKVFAAGEYAPTTPSGSFAQSALAELIDMAGWSDATLLAGDFGRNSETAILLEKFLQKYLGQLTLVQDAVDYFVKDAALVLGRKDSLLVLNMSQLQKLATAAKFGTAFTSQMDFLHVVEALHDFTKSYAINIILEHAQTVFVAVNGEVSSTKQESESSHTIKLAAYAAVWWLQNKDKAYETLTTSVAQLLTSNATVKLIL